MKTTAIFIAFLIVLSTATLVTVGVETNVTSIEGNQVKQVTKKILDVPYVYQGDTPWCGLASAVMLLRYYGHDTNLWDEARYLDWAPAETIFSSAGEYLGGWVLEKPLLQDKYGYQTEGIKWGGAWWAPDNVFSYLKDEIDNGTPVMLMEFTKYKHVIVVVGYEDNPDKSQRKVYVHDPSGYLTHDEFYLSTYPHKNVTLSWEQFSSFFQGFHAVKTVVIKDGNPNPIDVTVQLGYKSFWIYFPFSSLCYDSVAGVKVRGVGISELRMNRGLVWSLDISELPDLAHKYVVREEEDSLAIYYAPPIPSEVFLHIGDVIGWDIEGAPSWKISLTTTQEDSYDINMGLMDEYGHIIEEHTVIVTEHIKPDESKEIDIKFDFGDFEDGSYKPFIRVYRPGEEEKVAEVFLPMIIIYSITPTVTAYADQTTIEAGNKLWGNRIISNPTDQTLHFRCVNEIRNSTDNLQKSWEVSGYLDAGDTWNKRGYIYIPLTAPSDVYTYTAMLYDADTSEELDRANVDFTVIGVTAAGTPSEWSQNYDAEQSS